MSRFKRKKCEREREKSVRRKSRSAISGETRETIAREESPFATGYECHSHLICQTATLSTTLLTRKEQPNNFFLRSFLNESLLVDPRSFLVFFCTEKDEGEPEEEEWMTRNIPQHRIPPCRRWECNRRLQQHRRNQMWQYYRHQFFPGVVSIPTIWTSYDALNEDGSNAAENWLEVEGITISVYLVL
ncbi:uncharacterized protein LOC114937634 [Nylanderia fulva]|uniref:uncharacterized protein LOC114937634 n=1 Tax=Nylanderia fulva TaxID=613905 RepID=UPI0010FB0C34|nr:uncharacterized protein LOC114937634 [Nylanderia fulva]